MLIITHPASSTSHHTKLAGISDGVFFPLICATFFILEQDRTLASDAYLDVLPTTLNSLGLDRITRKPFSVVVTGPIWSGMHCKTGHKDDLAVTGGIRTRFVWLASFYCLDLWQQHVCYCFHLFSLVHRMGTSGMSAHLRKAGLRLRLAQRLLCARGFQPFRDAGRSGACPRQKGLGRSATKIPRRRR